MVRRVLACVVVVVVVLVWWPSIASATAFTATYSFDGSPGDQASEPVDANPVGALFSDITRGPGVTPTAGLNSINSSDWTTAATPDLAGDYYQLIITPLPGFELDITEIDYTLQRSLTGPRNFEFRSSVDGFSTRFGTVNIKTIVDANIRVVFFETPSLGAMLNQTTPLTIRLYGSGAVDSAGTFRLGIDSGSSNLPPDNRFVVVGDLSPVATVPEPLSLFLLGTGLVTVSISRRRNRRSDY
jgi:PEP-CTERM motif-containing protein